jgi:3-oxoacyl-[acyl-carrier-protein] synthase II
MTRRVVVSGAGLLTPVGNSLEESWKALLDGQSGVGEITRFDATGFSTRFAAEVRDLNVQEYLEKKDIRRMDLFLQYAIVAASKAVEDAGLKCDELESDRFGVIIGSGIGGISTIETQHHRLIDGGPSRISPFFVPMMISNIASGQVSMRFGAKGPNYSTVSACASGLHAIGDAFRWIKYGDADIFLAGGAEAAITPMSVGGFCSMKALSTRNDDPKRASRPFDRDRDGFVLGEGAGVVVLEELGHARRRGAKILAEVVGYGMTADAYHITAPAPEGEGAVRAMIMALKEGNVKPEAVDYINAHGTSTDLNDKFETMAIKRVFKEHAYNLMISSSKSMTGHLLGAAGGIEFVITMMAIVEGCIPPTINYENPDPECDLDYVPNKARKVEIGFAITNSFGFGGQNACLTLKKYHPDGN